MVGAIEQEFLDERGIAGDEARAHAGRIRALRQAGERHQSLVRASELARSLQSAERRFAAVDLRVAFVRCDNEAMAIGELEKRPPVVQLHDLAARIGGRAGVDKLHALPALRRSVDRGGAGQKGRAFIDLIEGVGAHHLGAARRVEHGLGEGEERLAGTVDRQDLGLGIRRRDAIATGKPRGDGLAQLGRAGGQRIGGKAVERLGERVLDQARSRMLWLADLQVDRREVRRRRVAANEGAQLLERIGL